MDWYDFGARMLMPDIGRWAVIDPKADKFTVVSPYVYTLNNPIILVDPDGKDVKPTNAGALKAIRNTLTASDQAYVKLDKNGMIDKNLLNSHASKSGNFNALKAMVNDKRTTEVTMGNEYKYKDKDGSIKTGKVGVTYSNELKDAEKLMPGYTKDQLKGMGLEDKVKGNGTFGITLLPGGEKEAKGDGKGSANGNVVVIISGDLTEVDAARTQAHEGNGHALFFIQGKDPNHSEDRTSEGGNKELEDQISKSVKEAEKNYDDTHKKKTGN